MESGYKILWTEHALTELAQTFEYIETYFTEREMRKLSAEIDRTLNLISHNPRIFPKSESKEIRKAILKKFNTMYYRTKDDNVEILSFFSNRQNPDKRKL